MDVEKIILDLLNSIGQINFGSVGSFVIFLLIAFWAVVVGWVWVDSGERTSKTYARVIYVLVTLFLNVPGLIIYLIVRPSETIEEIYWADLERRYLKYETAELGDCPKCGNQLYPGHIFCTNCGYELKVKCPKCEVLVEKCDKYCSFCGNKLNNRAAQEDAYPSVEVMQQQILATKEVATETVESNRIRYKSGRSIVVKIGDAILTTWNSLVTNVSNLNVMGKIEQLKPESTVSAKSVVKAEKKSKKKKKNRKK